MPNYFTKTKGCSVMKNDLYAGLDLGTSGIRLCIIDADKNIINQSRIDYSAPQQQTAALWWHHSGSLLKSLPEAIKKQLRYLAIDGTSGSLLLTDNNGEPYTQPLLYNNHDTKFHWHGQTLSDLSDTFVRVLRLLKSVDNLSPKTTRIVTQADYIKGKLTGQFTLSDENNCFKLGYDSLSQQWPAWITDYSVTQTMLPSVVAAGNVVAHIERSQAIALGLPTELQLVAGTTDSIAAVMATGIDTTGSAVTSLGSTLVLKILADHPITDLNYGVYSQPYQGRWLVGGASNCGGQILRQFFDAQTMHALSAQISIQHPTGLHYYPLTSIGERFPINDPHKQPELSPRPASDVVFFQALLESLSAVEQLGYQRLQQLGAPAITHVMSVGGGSYNQPWLQLRQHGLGLPVITARYTEAAYGSALLALQGALSK
jgi:sugar (pentulose or hexulose) kinase